MAAHAVATEIKALLPQAVHNVDVAFRVGTELGIDVECVKEWAIVRRAPIHAKVQVGDVLAAIDGDDVLLGSYEAMFSRVLKAKTSGLPYTLTFRRAPCCRGWLRKKPRESSAKDGHRSLGGWKTRFFVLAEGELVYYEKENGIEKGSFAIDGCSIAVDEVLTVERGEEKLVVTASYEELVKWAAWLQIAVAFAAGGDEAFFAAERDRQATLAARRRTSRRYSRTLPVAAPAG